MKVHLYLDEDAMDGDLAQALRMRGMDVQTALEAGLINTPDDKQLAYATSHERYCIHSMWRTSWLFIQHI